jgi:hypothetical protein
VLQYPRYSTVPCSTTGTLSSCSHFIFALSYVERVLSRAGYLARVSLDDPYIQVFLCVERDFKLVVYAICKFITERTRCREEDNCVVLCSTVSTRRQQIQGGQMCQSCTGARPYHILAPNLPCKLNSHAILAQFNCPGNDTSAHPNLCQSVESTAF